MPNWVSGFTGPSQDNETRTRIRSSSCLVSCESEYGLTARRDSPPAMGEQLFDAITRRSLESSSASNDRASSGSRALLSSAALVRYPGRKYFPRRCAVACGGIPRPLQWRPRWLAVPLTLTLNFAVTSCEGWSLIGWKVGEEILRPPYRHVGRKLEGSEGSRAGSVHTDGTEDERMRREEDERVGRRRSGV